MATKEKKVECLSSKVRNGIVAFCAAMCFVGAVVLASSLIVSWRENMGLGVNPALRAENTRLEQRNAELEYALDKLLTTSKEQQAALNVCAEVLEK